MAKKSAKSVAKLSRPASLKEGHVVSAFDCGDDLITSWLRKQAKKANQGDTARTFVVCRGTKRVVAYYSLAAGGTERVREGGGQLTRNAPHPVPVIILARLGVDKSERGNGLGQDMLADAMKRALQAAKIIGARALLVHAINEKVGGFYKSQGFMNLNPPDDLTFYLPMKTIRDALA
jgi:GNAT superfamily N-acetyltransferase